ncbi:MAG TPA: RICIN domain-containing protein, partial [Jatrophihabitantaceae bacterium]
MCIVALCAGLTSQAAAGAAPRDPAKPVRTVSAPALSASSAVPAPPADIVGPPAASTVARGDDVLLTQLAADGGATQQLFHPSADMGSLTDASSGVGDDVRTPQHPAVSVSARPRNPFADRAMSFNLTNAGSNGLWTVGTSDDPVESHWGVGKVPETPVVGQTYQISTKLGIITQKMAENGTSGDFGEQVVGTPLLGPSPYSPNSARLQWTVESAGDGYVQLVNRSDGLCLNDLGGSTAPGAAVGLWYCQDEWSGHRENEWRIVNDNGTFLLQSAVSGLFLTNDGGFTQEVRATTTTGQQQQSMLWTPVSEPGGVVPTWSAPTAKDPSLPMAMATGDLDRAVDPGGFYHDETVIAYANQDKALQVRVLDYNANDSHMLVTGSTATLNVKIGATVDGTWYPGSVGVAVGDFNGDDLNEIAVTYQNASGAFVVALLSYSADGAQRTLSVLNPSAAVSDSNSTGRPSLISGMAQITAGDFEGVGRADLAIGFGAGADDAHLHPELWAASFTDANKQATQRAFQPAHQGPTDDTTLQAPPVGQAWTAHGVRIASGLYRYDPAKGYLLHRRELALAWSTATQYGTLFVSGTYLATINVNRTDLAMTAMNNQYLAVSRAAGTVAQLDAQPLWLSTGGFAGRGSGSDVPQWGIALSGTELSDPQNYSSPNEAYITIFRNGAAGAALSRGYFRLNDMPGITWRLSAYDEAGRSIILGAPAVMHLQSLSRPTLIAQQPAAQQDWLNGKFVNVSSTPDFAVTMGSGKSSDITISHTTKASETFGVSQGFDSKTTVKAGLFGVETVGGSLDAKQAFSKDWDTENTDFSKYSSTSEYTEQASTTNDDIVNGYLTPYTVYRYPILGATLTKPGGGAVTTPTCSTDCRPYYEVSVPGTSIGVHAGGRDLSWYQPSWQNNNALSYPTLVDGLAPTPEIGSYTYTDKSGASQTSSAPLFNQSTDLGGTTHSYDLKLSTTNGGGSERTSGGSMKNSGEITAGVNVKF